jgi:hypothetical protein
LEELRVVPCSSSKKLIAEPIMASKEYLSTARILLRVARSMTDQAIANRLKVLSEDYERRAERAQVLGFGHQRGRSLPRNGLD